MLEPYDLAADRKAARNIFDAEDARHREIVEQLRALGYID